MEMDWGLDKKTPKETLEQLRLLIDKCWNERIAVKTETDKLEARLKVVIADEQLIKELLESAGLPSFAGTACVYELKDEINISGPQSDEDWEKFKGWVKEKYPKAYDTFFKMHMGSLKSFVGKELAIAEQKAAEAKERGEEVPKFVIPGIPEPKPFTLLKPKKKGKKA